MKGDRYVYKVLLSPKMPPTGSSYRVPGLTFGALLSSLLVYTLLNTMWTPGFSIVPLATLVATSAATVDLRWYPPANTQINNLSSAINGTGVYGYIYNTSFTPDESYGTYNWCNMPHVRKLEYVIPSKEYKLRYVEVVCLLTILQLATHIISRKI